MSDGLLRCRSCNARTSLTAGTIFEGTRKPLRTWFLAMWFVTSQKNGVSALDCSGHSGWEAMRRPGLGSTSCAGRWSGLVGTPRGAVEIDETYIGGPEKEKGGRETECKAIVAVAAEKSGQRHRPHPTSTHQDVSGGSLMPFVPAGRVPELLVHTDGWSGYAGWRRPATSTRSRHQPR